MYINRVNNHLVIFALILIIGLGFALTLPWLANYQGVAAKLDKSNFTDISIYNDSKLNMSSDPMCFATLNDGNTLPYSSDDATAVQQAVDDALPGDIVKVAGTCIGVQTRAGHTQTVYISKSLTLEGGHTTDDWTLEPDPETYTTTLDANRLGRVVVVSGTVDVNLDNLFLQEEPQPPILVLLMGKVEAFIPTVC